MPNQPQSTAIISGPAVIENIRQPDAKLYPRTFYLDAYFFTGPGNPPLTALLRFYDEHGTLYSAQESLNASEDMDTHTECSEGENCTAEAANSPPPPTRAAILIFFVQAIVVKMENDVDVMLSDASPTDYILCGDVIQMWYAGPSANPRQRPSFFLSGTVLHIDPEQTTFEMTAHPSVTLRRHNPTFPATVSMARGRFEKLDHKPFPTAGAVATIAGQLHSVVMQKALAGSLDSIHIDCSHIWYLGANNPPTISQNRGAVQSSGGAPRKRFNFDDLKESQPVNKRPKRPAAPAKPDTSRDDGVKTRSQAGVSK